MNIKEAKNEIKNAIKAYFTKNAYGEYVIPIEKQRPVFLLGAPGIGKTAVMEQIASELGVGLVSYSMTHHTRQSALGLPFIETKTYGGKEYSVSEYTMSEIIASVYDMIETTGKTEGILFLDEINCVSETLAPSMLQFLQYKVFGRHRVPDGWIVVTAGNPPEYNNSVREFDIVTWDRLKRVDVEPDYDAWREYAINNGVHPAVLGYLDIKKTDFYKIESTVDGKSFVTARGWSDLSAMISLYEKNGIPVGKNLVQQYLQNAKIAKEFAVYYDLFVKYRSSYQINDILDGNISTEIVERAKTAPFDERLALLGLLLNGISERIGEVWMSERTITEVLNTLKEARLAANRDLASVLEKKCAALQKEIETGTKASSLSTTDRHAMLRTLAILEEMASKLRLAGAAQGNDAFLFMKKDYDARLAAHKKLVGKASDAITNAFTFLEQAFADGQEMVIFVTELTVNRTVAWFIGRYGSEKYFRHNKELLFYERQKELIGEIKEIVSLEWVDPTGND
ncbi:MAG: AAA family ATPase [Clostridia bacterium]|nr:AAA family ATPase [Clostridia bacterium]